ncbi:MAG: hypothetical protein ACRDDY_09695 [Clostridium sp.]
MNDMEVLKLESNLKNLEGKINYTYEVTMWTRNTVHDNSVTLLDIIYWDKKENKFISELCAEKFRKHERNLIFGCENKYSKYDLNAHNTNEIIAEFIDSNNGELKGREARIVRYLFFAILGTTLIEENEKYKKRIADIAACLNISAEIIEDITNVINYIITSDKKFEFKTKICKETLENILV